MRLRLRRVWVPLSESYPYAELFHQILENLRRSAPALTAT